MIMTDIHIPSFTASIKIPLSVSQICSALPDLTEELVRRLLEDQIKEHFILFGIMPYGLEFDRKGNTYIIKPNSVIGRFDCHRFILEIKSKFEDTSIGKWLELSNLASADSSVLNARATSETLTEEDRPLSNADYFSLALVNSSLECLKNGFVTANIKSKLVSKELNGPLDLTRFVARGCNPSQLPITKYKKTLDCRPNQLVKAALQVVRDRTEDQNIRARSNELLLELKEVQSISEHTSNSLKLDDVSSIPRPDYTAALTLSRIILEGFSMVGGQENSFSPFFSIELDSLFEKLMATEVKRLLTDKYIVEIQPKFDHPAQPKIKKSFFSPDLVISKRDSDMPKVVLDTKNKISVGSLGDTTITNADIYQMSYYCSALGSTIGVLVYPEIGGSITKYPLRGSEGESAYIKKQHSAIKKIAERGDLVHFTLNGTPIPVLTWRIRTSGTVYDTRKSIAELTTLLSDICDGKVSLSGSGVSEAVT